MTPAQYQREYQAKLDAMSDEDLVRFIYKNCPQWYIDFRVKLFNYVKEQEQDEERKMKHTNCLVCGRGGKLITGKCRKCYQAKKEKL